MFGGLDEGGPVEGCPRVHALPFHRPAGSSRPVQVDQEQRALVMAESYRERISNTPKRTLVSVQKGCQLTTRRSPSGG